MLGVCNVRNFEKLKGRRRAPGNDEDPPNVFFKILGMNSISIKKHEMDIWYLLYFQVRDSPAPLNIPTPTLAPDRGGPVSLFHKQDVIGYHYALVGLLLWVCPADLVLECKTKEAYFVKGSQFFAILMMVRPICCSSCFFLIVAILAILSVRVMA